MTPYTLTPATKRRGETALHIALLDAQGFETRGATLARALRGRWAPGSRCFFLTPVRAKKWEALYTAGWSARQVRVGCDYVWRFFPPFETHRRGRPTCAQLNHAMDRVRPEFEFA